LFLFGPVVLISIALGLVLGGLVHGPEFLQNLVLGPGAAPEADASAQTTQGGAGVNTAHLWFLYYLLIFYAAALTVRALIHALDPRRRLAAILDRAVAFAMRGIWGPALIALPLIAYFVRADGWNEWIGLPAPFSLMPDMSALVGYGVAFGLGWLLHRQKHLLLALQTRWYLFLAAAIALTFVSLRVVGAAPIWTGPSLEGSDRAVYTVAYMIGIWCWIFAFVGASVRFLSDESPVNRYLADASYWIYLMHMTTIMFFITVLRPFDWHWSIKFAIYVLGSLPILIVSYHYLVRFSWIGAVLNGRRHSRPGKTPPSEAVPAAR
jgi:hypothetical protein